jgi:ABC-type dipeptide/oligopeptide/nickel transport system ATPase subunit
LLASIAKADLAITMSQDQVTLLRTRYNVRRAELDVQRNPIISEIDGKKNVLTLEQQKRSLQQLETDILARKEQSDSQLAVLQEQRNRSLMDIQRELQRIALVRALLCRPRFIFADEPSSRLDMIAQHGLMQLLGEVAQAEGIGILLVSHDAAMVSAMCERVHAIGGLLEAFPETPSAPDTGSARSPRLP